MEQGFGEIVQFRTFNSNRRPETRGETRRRQDDMEVVEQFLKSQGILKAPQRAMTPQRNNFPRRRNDPVTQRFSKQMTNATLQNRQPPTSGGSRAPSSMLKPMTNITTFVPTRAATPVPITNHPSTQGSEQGASQNAIASGSIHVHGCGYSKSSRRKLGKLGSGVRQDNTDLNEVGIYKALATQQIRTFKNSPKQDSLIHFNRISSHGTARERAAEDAHLKRYSVLNPNYSRQVSSRMVSQGSQTQEQRASREPDSGKPDTADFIVGEAVEDNNFRGAEIQRWFPRSAMEVQHQSRLQDYADDYAQEKVPEGSPMSALSTPPDVSFLEGPSYYGSQQATKQEPLVKSRGDLLNKRVQQANLDQCNRQLKAQENVRAEKYFKSSQPGRSTQPPISTETRTKNMTGSMDPEAAQQPPSTLFTIGTEGESQARISQAESTPNRRKVLEKLRINVTEFESSLKANQQRIESTEQEAAPAGQSRNFHKKSNTAGHRRRSSQIHESSNPLIFGSQQEQDYVYEEISYLQEELEINELMRTVGRPIQVETEPNADFSGKAALRARRASSGFRIGGGLQRKWRHLAHHEKLSKLLTSESPGKKSTTMISSYMAHTLENEKRLQQPEIKSAVKTIDRMKEILNKQRSKSTMERRPQKPMDAYIRHKGDGGNEEEEAEIEGERRRKVSFIMTQQGSKPDLQSAAALGGKAARQRCLKIRTMPTNESISQENQSQGPIRVDNEPKVVHFQNRVCTQMTKISKKVMQRMKTKSSSPLQMQAQLARKQKTELSSPRRPVIRSNSSSSNGATRKEYFQGLPTYKFSKLNASKKAQVQKVINELDQRHDEKKRKEFEDKLKYQEVVLIQTSEDSDSSEEYLNRLQQNRQSVSNPKASKQISVDLKALKDEDGFEMKAAPASHHKRRKIRMKRELQQKIQTTLHQISIASRASGSRTSIQRKSIPKNQDGISTTPRFSNLSPNSMNLQVPHMKKAGPFGSISRGSHSRRTSNATSKFEKARRRTSLEMAVPEISVSSSSSYSSQQSQNGLYSPADKDRIGLTLSIDRTQLFVPQSSGTAVMNAQIMSKDTAALLEDLTKEVIEEADKRELISKLKDNLKDLMRQSIEFETKRALKTFEKTPFFSVKDKNSPVLSLLKRNIQKEVQERIKNRTSKAYHDGSLGDIGFFEDHLGQVMDNLNEGKQDKTPKRRRRKGRLAMLIRKHFLNKKKFNLQFLIAVVNMQDKLEKLLKRTKTIGGRYQKLGKNLWTNTYLLRAHENLRRKGVNFPIDFASSQFSLMNANRLFKDAVSKQLFFETAKQQGRELKKFEGDRDRTRAEYQRYIENCSRSYEIPLPTFAKLNDNRLYLSQVRMTDCMSLALQNFLIASKEDSEFQVKQLFIDDCTISDTQLAHILQGVRAQGTKIQTIVYSNSSQFGPEGMKELVELVPKLLELQLNNLSGTVARVDYLNLLDAILNMNSTLMKLKLSQVDLNDTKLAETLCNLLNEKELLTHIDISWCKMQPKYLSQIAYVLKSNPYFLKSLNLSNNTLYFDEGNKQQPQSEDFLFSLIEFINESKTLLHVDFSGMNFGKDQVRLLASCLSTSPSLLAIHMSDNGIREDKDFMLEVLEMFDISEENLAYYPDAWYKLNRVVENPGKLKGIIKQYCGAVSMGDTFADRQNVNVEGFKKYLIQSKQSRTVQNHKLINQTQIAKGIGRLETNQIDFFVLTRKRNNPELVFNQSNAKDCYFELEAGQQWVLSEKNDCFVCQKHKYSVIFFDQTNPMGQRKQAYRTRIAGVGSSKVDYSGSRIISGSSQYVIEPESTAGDKLKPDQTSQINTDLVEIKDLKLAEEVKENIHLMYNEMDEIAPIIVGTVVHDRLHGFKRKLRMLRADLFAALSVSESIDFVKHEKQSQAIKKGIHALITDNQNIKVKECIQYFKGWEYILKDKCLNNQSTDLAVINTPQCIKQPPPLPSPTEAKKETPRETAPGKKPKDKAMPKSQLDHMHQIFTPQRRIGSPQESPMTARHFTKSTFGRGQEESPGKSPGGREGFGASPFGRMSTGESPLGRTRPEVETSCPIYAYATYLPPGRHQFLIYCPVRRKVYCKDIVIDLNMSDQYPEYPRPLKEKMEKQVHRIDVWKKWRVDSEEDLQFAFFEDIKQSFEPEMFIKDLEDVERCKEILSENFKELQIFFLEGLAGSSKTFPEISSEQFFFMILDQQQNWPRSRKRLQRSQLEVSFIASTRTDDAKGLLGALCRGELLELTLRLCKQTMPSKMAVSDYLEEFLNTYIKGVSSKSDIPRHRKTIRMSQPLNHLLFDNSDGLKKLFKQYSERGGSGPRFSQDSARRMMAPVFPELASTPFFTSAVRRCFVFSKMTNLFDLSDKRRYFSLVYVEYLEFICRFALTISEHLAEQANQILTPPPERIPLGGDNGNRAIVLSRRDSTTPGGSQTTSKKDIKSRVASLDIPVEQRVETKVYELLQLLWTYRLSNGPKESKLKKLSKSKRILLEFPELKPIVDDFLSDRSSVGSP